MYTYHDSFVFVDGGAKIVAQHEDGQPQHNVGEHCVEDGQCLAEILGQFACVEGHASAHNSEE